MHTARRQSETDRDFPRLLDLFEGQGNPDLCDNPPFDWTVYRTGLVTFQLRSYSPLQWATMPECDRPEQAQLLGGQFVVPIVM